MRVPLTAGQGTIQNADYAAFSAETGKVTASPVDVAVEPYALQAGAAVDRAYAPPNSPLTYTFALTNPHPFAALSPLTLTVTLPPHAVLVNASAPYTHSGQTVVFGRASLAAGGVWTSQVKVSSPSTGSLPLTYTAESGQTAPISGTVSAQVGALGVTLSDSGYLTRHSPVYTNGTALTFTHTITNTSAFTLTFTFTLSDDLGWTLGAPPSTRTLGPGESAQITVSISLPANAPPGAYNRLRMDISAQETPTLHAEIVDEVRLNYVLFLPLMQR